MQTLRYFADDSLIIPFRYDNPLFLISQIQIVSIQKMNGNVVA
jgi:hypothetical protein